MHVSGLVKLKCYVILEGFETSLGENLFRNFDILDPNFFSEDEIDRALKRLREDIDEPDIEIGDMHPTEIISYLDLGDLVNILNRHSTSAKNILIKDITIATQLINTFSALTIRKRVMHPVRPLEIDDLQQLQKMAEQVQSKAPSLFWTPLEIALRRIVKGEIDLDFEIPDYWVEESGIINNLPPAEFDDTGFIGRNKERKDLKKLLGTEHPVITVIGGGGIGKTALSLRVCNDILDEESSLFDRIVWVSLKTKYLTHEGIREIQNSVDTVGYLIQSIFHNFDGNGKNAEEGLNWDGVIGQLKITRTLLVIDNLETIGEEIRELALNIPKGSKLLLTSRVGLGEIEVRYSLSEFLPKDAMQLFRSLTNLHNFQSLASIKSDIVHDYVKNLYFNPLLIKWFILAVGNGADPRTLLNSPKMNEALEFCYENVYEQLYELEKTIISVLMAARRELSSAQVMELVEVDLLELIPAVQNLVRTSMVSRLTKDDGSVTMHLSNSVFDYLNTLHAPPDTLVSQVRQRIREWHINQDKITSQVSTQRYDSKSIHATNQDEYISAQHLIRAMKSIHNGKFPEAEIAISRAEQITPVWWEVFRIKAHLLGMMGRPIYEIENAYEKSLSCDENDINLYFYAVYLNRVHEYERAIEQIEKAEKYSEAQFLVLSSVKANSFLRLGRTEEAVTLMKNIWDNRTDNSSPRQCIIFTTQLSDAYRRNMEQLRLRGMLSEMLENYNTAIDIINTCITTYGCDARLVEKTFNLIIESRNIIRDDDNAQKRTHEMAHSWENSNSFVNCSQLRLDIVEHFSKSPILVEYFPTITDILRNL